MTVRRRFKISYWGQYLPTCRWRRINNSKQNDSLNNFTVSTENRRRFYTPLVHVCCKFRSHSLESMSMHFFPSGPCKAERKFIKLRITKPCDNQVFSQIIVWIVNLFKAIFDSYRLGPLLNIIIHISCLDICKSYPSVWHTVIATSEARKCTCYSKKKCPVFAKIVWV